LGRIKGHSFSIFSLRALIGFNGLFLAQINTLCPTSLQNFLLLPSAFRGFMPFLPTSIIVDSAGT
jgi:hypothetical protein